MSSTRDAPQRPQPPLVGRVDELRQDLGRIPAQSLAERTGVEYLALDPGRGEFRLSLFDSALVVPYPGFAAVDHLDDPAPITVQAVLAYYFHASDGHPLAGEWVSFAELPDGRTYNTAFQGYTGNELVKAFGTRLGAFRSACEACGGVQTPLGDAAFSFHALPRLPLLVNFWLGDEDFPSTCKILFDRSASHYLPTDVCAILGSMLVRKLVKKAR